MGLPLAHTKTHVQRKEQREDSEGILEKLGFETLNIFLSDDKIKNASQPGFSDY